jgi:hypothetical protein
MKRKRTPGRKVSVVVLAMLLGVAFYASHGEAKVPPVSANVVRSGDSGNVGGPSNTESPGINSPLFSDTERAASEDPAKRRKPFTYCKEVAPILQKHCMECHHDGGIAPFSLETYQDARPWAVAIKEVVLQRRMPPFHATGPVGRYVGDPRLKADEISIISKWVDAGAPKGDPADMPKPKTWTSDWKSGKPDVTAGMQTPFTVKPDGKDDYAFFVLSHTFPADTWIKALEVRPGNRKAVHHVNVYILPPEVRDLGTGRVADVFDPVTLGAKFLVAWEPGCAPLTHTEGVATLIPKGSRFGIQIHYSPTTVPLEDRTQLGFHFAEGRIIKQARVLYGGTRTLEIPAGVPEHQVLDRRQFAEDAVITGFSCHLHVRGKSFVVRLRFPNNYEDIAFEVPKFDPNWQEVYVLANPIKVPKGTHVEFIATWDNSKQNPFNPDPTKVVKWGDRVEDEMMDGYVYYVTADEQLGLVVSKGQPDMTAVKTTGAVRR